MTTTHSHALSRLLAIAALAFGALFFVSNKAYAYGNDFLEKQDNYRAYANGQNRVHFQFPVYSRGSHDYYAGSESSDSYAYYMLKGSSSKVKVFYYGGQRESDQPSADDDYSYGRAYIKAADVGVIEVTNTTSGQRRVITPGSWVLLDVKKKKEATNGDDYVTWLEVDWYPYETLEDTTFRVGTAVDIRRRMTGNTNYSKDWILEEGLRGVNNTIKPQLYDPYFYAVNETGNAGYGYAAVPYMVFDEPISYTTSLSSKSLITTDRAGTIFVPTTDTIQEGFYATFTTWYDKAHEVKRAPQQTTKVNIPAYHRIYDFFVKEEKDESETFTGNNVLTWSVKNPHLPDLVSGDFFEIQRALKSDFSDAQTIDIVAMQRGLDKSTYTYVDKSRESWTGHVATEYETVDANVEYLAKDYPILAANGDTMCHLDIKASSDKLRLPSVPVYYRIRRASASMWGWKGHDFARDASCLKRSYLAPLASTQPEYTLNTETRQVDFRIQIENANTDIGMPAAEDVKLEFTINDVDSVDLTIVGHYYSSSMPTGFVRITPVKGEVQKFSIQDWIRSFRVPYGAVVEVGTRYSSYSENVGAAFTLTKPAAIITTSIDNYNNWTATISEQSTSEAVEARFAEVRTQIVDSLRPLLQAKAITGLGRCMWDKSASLVLIKTTDGVKQEYIIPQDSIRRLANGNWEAHYTDLANHACTNYSYAVRIDQSNSDLHVSDSAFLLPKVLTGPNLYFEEGASIKEFNATQGDANSDRKRGVYLNWQPSTMAVDEYILTRVKENSSEVADTLYTGLENSFFDITAQPLQRYEYTITAVYDCNGKHSDHAKSVIGWRTKYGEISGQVFMPDNSGMTGVNVALQGPDGQTMRTTITDANGAYRFDSIEYPIATGGNYVVIPTHAYGTFNFNNTTATTASITLSADNAIAYGIYFYNTSTVRLSGRALYKNSTIPVAGAMFVLNNDTVRRNRAPLTTGIDGNFELTLTMGQPYTLQIVKKGHTFEGEGILRVEGGSETFALTQSLDGVRFYDETKVRLIGRVAGGNDQRDLPHGFGLGKNNLGDDLQLVLQLEGDNTAHFVHDPNDLTRDTLHQSIDSTETLFEKKRVIIRPDQKTGEYAVDLFPVKYKVVQASANGYATLFASGQGSETFDLTESPLKDLTETYEGDTVHYQALYDRIYHTPVQIHLTQLLYGLEQDGFGEKTMKAGSFAPNAAEEVELYSKGKDGTVTYTLGHPLFYYNRRYQFQAFAFEDYYYNNDPEAGSLDRVPQRSGQVTIHNGMHSTTEQTTYTLDNTGRNSAIWLPVDRLETEIAGEGALRTVSAALTIEGNTVETDVFRAFVTGDMIHEKELQATEADINLLDIIRDPGGNGSYAWVENGTTYSYSYTESYDWNAGLTLSPQYGVDVSADLGTVTAPSGAGTYSGSSMNVKKHFSFDIPITHEWSWGYKYNYTFTTSDKITTSSKSSRDGIGSNADVFLGTTISQLCGKAKSVAVINDSLYQARQPAIQSGAMKVLANGVDSAGTPYHLVVGEKVVLGTKIDNTFAYSQHYILKTILPQIILKQMNLLMYFPNEQAAQSAANAAGEPVYWYLDSTQLSMRDSVDKAKYKMLLPTGSTKVYNDEVAALNHMFSRWASLIINNEREKVIARMTGRDVGTYSVSYGNTYTHTNTYSALANYNKLPQGGGLVGAEAQEAAAQLGEKVLKQGSQIAKIFDESDINKYFDLLNDAMAGITEGLERNEMDLGNKSMDAKWSLKIMPTLDFDTDSRTSDDVTQKKTAGFTISPDNQGDITVSVYRAPADSLWKNLTSSIRENVNHGGDDDKLYGSYVFFTQAGSTFCIHEEEEKTQFYNPGMILNNATMALAVPEISIDNYEKTNIPADQRAKFRIELRNAGQVHLGSAAGGRLFTLELSNNSNPNGAKLYVNGAPLSQGIEYFMEPGESVVQILEVERGEVDDYDELKLMFKVSDCPKNLAFLDFSVHFMPVSCDVNIAYPRQNWVMNTLSQRDSTGYYMPIEIDGFDIWHKNFDHIEFQYKLSTESEDMWVNLCSFYAGDSLYDQATGNKAKIINGRIAPFRFYGERDPMEQQYDLRAVSFSRYGSGFVHKASPVISGVKDTRPPVVFGDPEPANSILSVGDHLKLRFSEPIAGNYLDEDNNFSLKGVTNKTGITAGTSLHFDGTDGCYATTKVDRNLADKSVSIDMLVKPSEANQAAVFFSHGSGDNATTFGITADRRLYLTCHKGTVYSKQLEQMIEFTRVTVVYDYESNAVRFFAGTKEMTDPAQQFSSSEAVFYNAPLVFGRGFNGNMLETRIWSKALTHEEIAATHLRRLSGYERGLTAYYPMNEGRGTDCSDKANGATLYLSSTTWTLQKGISLQLQNDSVTLNGNLLSRSDTYDETFMLWFKTASKSAPLFRAGWTRTDSVMAGSWLGLEDGLLTLRSDSNAVTLLAQASDNEWHHFALAINRSYNTASFFLDGKLLKNVPATEVRGLRGAMYLGGKGFTGNIDELTVYEQALPRALIEESYNMAPAGDEMGLMAYLPFSEQVLNPNGVLELVFSPNDQRTFKNPDGKVIDKVVTLVKNQPNLADKADKTNFAPVRDHGLLNKFYFGWAFNTDELLINIRMQDYEINKQTAYITVRDVEDLHGNPMQSPVTWLAFVDRNTLKWENSDVYYSVNYEQQEDLAPYTLNIRNISGRVHQYTIDNVPEWLSVRNAGGTLTALEQKPVELRLTRELAPGEYTETLYLTDENELAEPLNIHLTVVANPPYGEVDEDAYPFNMSLCANVLVDNGTSLAAADEQDIIYAFCSHRLVGKAHVTFNDRSNKSELFMTINGDEDMTRKPVTFQLWRASTGKTYSLYCPRNILFAHGYVYGCGDENPIYLTTTGTETMSIPLKPGWTWISANLDFTKTQGLLGKCTNSSEPWSEGDQIKNPATRKFANCDTASNLFVGSLTSIHHSQIYMVCTRLGNTLRIAGDQLPPDSMHIKLRGDGQWNALPCLLSRTTSLAEALADYYDHATPGDLIKGKKQFAYFSADRRWTGDLTALTPGEGYLMRRMGKGSVTVNFYNKSNNAGAPTAQRANSHQPAGSPQLTGSGVHTHLADNSFTNPAAATNMTVIARVESHQPHLADQVLRVFVGDELAAVAEPYTPSEKGQGDVADVLYFLTIQSDRVGELRFVMGDQTLKPVDISTNRNIDISNVADTHHGSLRAPVVLVPVTGNPCPVTSPYKLIEDDRVVIIRNGKRYDVTGQKL